MKVLNVEDNPIKHCQIRRALEQCGVKEVDCCNNLQDALYLLEERTGMGRRYDLIVTDMNYPLEKGGETCGQAGEILIQRIKEDGLYAISPIPKKILQDRYHETLSLTRSGTRCYNDRFAVILVKHFCPALSLV